MKTASLICIFFTAFGLEGVCGEIAETSMRSETKEIIKEIDKKGNGGAILTLGKLGDRSAVPFLKKILAQRSAGNSQHDFNDDASYAQMALAKLGEKKQLDEIIHELMDSAKADKLNNDPKKLGYDCPNGGEQDDAIKKLIYVGGPEAVKTLISFLDDPKYRKDRGGYDFALEPLSLAAMNALAKIVPNPPPMPTKEEMAIISRLSYRDMPPTATEEDWAEFNKLTDEKYDQTFEKRIQLWRKWWETNKATYQN